MTFAIIVLVCLLASLVLCLALRTSPASWCLLAFSALWLPANNNHLEGTVVFGVGAVHGMTTSDLISVAGFLVSLATLLWRSHRTTWPARRGADPAAIVVICALIFGLGAAAAYLNG
jgi:hypothetical protein